MKTKNILLTLSVIVLFAAGFGPQVSAAPFSARDASADAALIGDASNAGVLPPTGSMAVPAAGTSQKPFLDPALYGLNSQRAIVTPDQGDKEARVFEVVGEVKYIMKGIGHWEPLGAGTTIKKGHIIVTGKASSASVTFDNQYLNVTHIPENTKAEFKSIEPTEIFIQDGTLLNVLDSLPPGQSFKVSSPVAVAAVKGTHFAFQYAASDGQVINAVFDVPDDGVNSLVELIRILTDNKEGASVNVPEGNQITLKEGQNPSEDLFKKISREWLELIAAFLKKLAELRAQNGGVLPPTAGELFNPGLLDPAGPGGLGGNDHDLDPLDTGSGLGDPLGDNNPGSSSGKDSSEQDDRINPPGQNLSFSQG